MQNRRNIKAFKRLVDSWPPEKWEVIAPRSRKPGEFTHITKLCLRQVRRPNPRTMWWVVNDGFDHLDVGYPDREYRHYLDRPDVDDWLILGDLRALHDVEVAHNFGRPLALVKAMEAISKRLKEDAEAGR